MQLQPGMQLLLEKGAVLDYTVPHTTTMLERQYTVVLVNGLYSLHVYYPSLPSGDPNRLKCLAEQKNIDAFLHDIPSYLLHADFQLRTNFAPK